MQKLKSWLFLNVFYPMRHVVFVALTAVAGALAGSIVWGVARLCNAPADWAECAGVGAAFFGLMALSAVASVSDIRKREGW